MRVSIERAEDTLTYTTWFGLGPTHTRRNPFVRVTIHFSEEEKEIIKRAPLTEFLVFEHPGDEHAYRMVEEANHERRAKLSAVGAFFDEMTQDENPRYRKSKMVRHFLESPTIDIWPWEEGEMVLNNIEAAVESNLQELKKNIERLSAAHPASKRDFEL